MDICKNCQENDGICEPMQFDNGNVLCFFRDDENGENKENLALRYLGYDDSESHNV